MLELHFSICILSSTGSLIVMILFCRLMSLVSVVAIVSESLVGVEGALNVPVSWYVLKVFAYVGTEGETETVGVPNVFKKYSLGSSRSGSGASRTCSRSGFRCDCDIDRCIW